MNFRRLILIQKIAIIGLFFVCVSKTIQYYIPWIKTFIYGEFKASHYIHDNKSYHLIKSEEGFVISFLGHSIRFIASLILLNLSLYYYFKVLNNIHKGIYFSKKNYILLIKIGEYILLLGTILTFINMFSPRDYFISSYLLLFIGSIIYTIGVVFREAYTQKQENDLTI